MIPGDVWRTALSSEDILHEWLCSGIKDFYLAFFLEDNRIYDYATFFCHQGLEKICKAYLIPHHASGGGREDRGTGPGASGLGLQSAGERASSRGDPCLQCDHPEDPLLRSTIRVFGSGTWSRAVLGSCCARARSMWGVFDGILHFRYCTVQISKNLCST